MKATIRAAEETDLPAIRDIFEHYVLNTIVSFLVCPPPLSYVKRRFDSSRARNLPYLVAAKGPVVIGYAYASSFRGFMLGYGHAVEITVFVHHAYHGEGIGSMLLRELLADLTRANHRSFEDEYEDAAQYFEVKKVVAVMSVDEQSDDGLAGMGLRNWYLKFGFEQVGRLKGVGSKHGRSIDTLYLELDLETWTKMSHE